MRSFLLNNVDNFFYQLGWWSRLLTWIAVPAAVVFILVPMLLF
jgi:hypothetical protein